MFFHHRQIVDGRWDFFRPTAHLGMELMGKTLGIYGMGRIGKNVMRVITTQYNDKIEIVAGNDLVSAAEIAARDKPPHY